MADDPTSSTASGRSPRKPFVSQLPEARQRFLAHLIEDALELELRRPEDFVRHFPPEAIMSSLEDRPDLRAGILVLTTGIRQKIAQKKTVASAAEDLRLALSEGETDPEAVVDVFQADDRARYLDARMLWAYTIEGRFWTFDASRARDLDRARQLIVRMIDRAIEESLLTAEDVVEGVTVARLVEHLPKGEIVRVIEAALSNARGNMNFAETDLLKATELKTIVDHVPLPVLWEEVIVPRLARLQDFEAVAAPAPIQETMALTPPAPLAGARAPAIAVASPKLTVMDEAEDIEIETDVGRAIPSVVASKPPVAAASKLPWKSQRRP